MFYRSVIISVGFIVEKFLSLWNADDSCIRIGVDVENTSGILSTCRDDGVAACYRSHLVNMTECRVAES